MDRKWSKVDISIIILQVVAPIIAIIFTCAIPQGQALSPELKLVIICAGISIPIILLQISVTTGQNKNESDIKQLKEEILAQTKESSQIIKIISEKLNHISPILERVFLTGNDRAKRFVYRRMDEVTNIIQIALGSNNSGYLKPNEYYDELLYLADLIIKDHAEQNKNFKGEVWAMTSFADGEWIEEKGYERLWTEKLNEIVDKGIKTRRLCVIQDKIYELISSQAFSEENASKVKPFEGFIKYLENYYGTSTYRRQIAEHYYIRTDDNPELTSIKGFFAIMLSTSDLHILHGETVNENGALTAKVLFDSDEIQRVRKLFDMFARPNQELGKRILDISKENGFIEYLKNKGITLAKNANSGRKTETAPSDVLSIEHLNRIRQGNIHSNDN